MQAKHAAADGSKFSLLRYHDDFAVGTHLQHALRSTVENAALIMMRAAAAAAEGQLKEDSKKGKGKT